MANESCDAPDALDVKLTFWQRNNPYSWADPAKAMNRLVTPNNTVAVLQLLGDSRFCFEELSLSYKNGLCTLYV